LILVPDGTGPAKSLRLTGTTAVALTFDDGPDPVQTPKILELLAKYRVKATFCLVGDQVRKHPEIVRQIAAAGHTLCNHTWNHSLKIGKDKRAKIRADLRRTNDAIRAAVPDAAIPFFRAPGGNFTDALVETAYADGMTSLYWEVDPRDWEHPEDEDDAAHVDKIIKSVQKEVRPGSIVLSHDFNQPDTIRAYEELLPWLVDKFELGLPSEPKPSAEQPAAQAPAPEAPASGVE
jgi:peptidoglycan/xylan/chitin deacetylase (PgdA/CDA1 family)